MSEFRCDIKIPKTNLLQDENLTVGREFMLNCQGEWPEGFQLEQAQFKFEKNDKYLLKILRAEKLSSSEVQLQVTSYIPGKIDLPHLLLTDSSTMIDLGKLSFQVESVVVQENSQNAPPEPYGPMGPFSVAFPWMLVNYLVVVLVLAIMGVGYRIFRRVQRKNLLKKMEIYQTAGTAANAYYQSFRKIQRQIGKMDAKDYVVVEQDKIQVLEDIQMSWKVYLYQRFQIPSLYLSPSKILSEIKSESVDLASLLKTPIKNFERELKSAQNHLGRMKMNDLIQLLQSTQKMMDAIEKFDSQEKKIALKRKGL